MLISKTEALLQFAKRVKDSGARLSGDGPVAAGQQLALGLIIARPWLTMAP